MLLALMLSLLLIGCGGDEPQLVGWYKLDSMTQDGTTLDHAALEAAGTDGYLVLEEGGEGFIKLGRDTMAVTWENTGVIVDGKFEAMRLEGDALTLTEGTSVVGFIRSTEPAPVRPERFTRSLVGVAGKFDWIAVNQDGTTTKVENMTGYSGYVSFSGDGKGEFGIQAYGMKEPMTDALTVDSDGKLTDSTGYEIVYDYDGATLLLTMDGADYLYAPAQ